MTADRLRVRAAGRQPATHCSRRPLFQRTTGLPWNLTFGGAAEKVIGGDSGRSRAGTIDKDKPTVERQHPEAAYSRCRPKGVGGAFPVERPVHFGTIRSPKSSRCLSSATAVVRELRASNRTPPRLNGCIQKPRTGTADPVRSLDIALEPPGSGHSDPVRGQRDDGAATSDFASTDWGVWNRSR